MQQRPAFAPRPPLSQFLALPPARPPARSMDMILELEEQAWEILTPMPGLLELLAYLRSSGVRVGLVTRNTTLSLNAFFAGGRGEEGAKLALGALRPPPSDEVDAVWLGGGGDARACMCGSVSCVAAHPCAAALCWRSDWRGVALGV